MLRSTGPFHHHKDQPVWETLAQSSDPAQSLPVEATMVFLCPEQSFAGVAGQPSVQMLPRPVSCAGPPAPGGQGPDLCVTPDLEDN